MMSSNEICVIGSGVNGLSCALLLQQQGWDVTILSDEDPRKPSGNPAFASLYPAASIIPHSVSSDILHALFKESLQYFRKLYAQSFPGLKIHRHFELFVNKQPIPDYLELMEETEQWEAFKNQFHPSHPQIALSDGWQFKCFFVDWNLYYPALLNLFLEQSGQLNILQIQPEDISSLLYPVIINCSGIGSQQLFGDEHDLLYRGHLIEVHDTPALLSPDGEPVCYNFSPGTDVYPSEEGQPQDVYCYARQNSWILGGSRQKGRLDENGHWQGEQVIEPRQEINGTVIPGQILQLHRTILEHSFGVNPDHYPQKTVKTGYRYMRKEENGLRLESEEIDSKLVIHNYGHGGAGVTLSWGCAQKVLELLKQAMD